MHDEELGQQVDAPGDVSRIVVPVETGDGFTIREAWTNIEARLNDAGETLRRADAPPRDPLAYKSWIRWLHRLSQSSDAGDVFLSEAYWTLLQRGFEPASAEQRRYCLYILGKSIAILDQSVNVPCFAFSAGDVIFIEAYEKYCTLFSVFILDRYINQVEECLPELRDLAAPTGNVDPSWVIVLLGAALQHGIQDSVRKAVGEHFMTWGLTGYPETAVWWSFLTMRFLPWACQGYLFTGSIARRKNNTECEHGNKLADFIDRLAYLCVDGDEMLSLTRLLLSFIAETPKLFPYAGAFILAGLVRALKELAAELDFRLDEKGRSVATKAVGRADLPEMARAAWRTTCQALCQLNQVNEARTIMVGFESDDYTTAAQVEAFNLLQSNMPRGVVSSSCESMTDLLSQKARADISTFLALLDRSRHRCLQRDGLLLALVYVARCLEDPDLGEADQDMVYQALHAIWIEVEIQDYPKSALMQLPDIVFTANVLARCMENPEVCEDEGPSAPLEACTEYPPKSDLHQLILEIWQGLLRLSRGRIYVLAPLTRALHTLSFEQYGEGCWVDREVITPDGNVHMHGLFPSHRILPFNEFVIELATRPPRAKVEFQLEASLAPMLDPSRPPLEIYRQYYGETEGVAYAYMFDLLNRTSLGQQPTRHLIDRLLQPWLEQQMPVLIVSKWKHTIQLQLMVMLLQQLMDASLLSEYAFKFMKVLAIEPMPRYRYLLQWIVLIIYAKLEVGDRQMSANSRLAGEFTSSLLEPLRKVEQDNPKFLGSILKISVAICKLKGRKPSSFPTNLMTAMVAMCASPKIVVRHEAQWSFVALWNLAKTQFIVGDISQRAQWSSIIENPVLKALSEYMQSLDRYTNPPPERLLEEFDFDEDSTLTNLFEGAYLDIDPPEVPLLIRADFLRIWEIECHTPSPTVDVDHSQYGETLGSPYDKINGKGRMPLGEPRRTPAVKDDSHTANTAAEATHNQKAPLQTKAASWQTVLDTLSDSSLNPSLDRHVRPMIVFASHIASAVNLGGLSRASEVFGAESLVVAKADIVKDKAFLGVSVNSHLHLPIQEVKPDERTVLTWLHDRRKEGYGIVGVEQTDRSIVLGKKDGAGRDVLAFPKKCVLVMGSEKEGIPGWLLAECEGGCVEIPQVGVTRSLNVQTAAAVALYEYGRQWG